MEIQQSDTGIVFIDPQNDVLSETGTSWAEVGASVTENGTIENWGFEMGGPNSLRNSGWTKDTMKIGDEVIVEGSLAKNGSRNVNAKNVTMASTGKKLGAASSQGNTVD